MSILDSLFNDKEILGIKKSKLRKLGYKTGRQWIKGQLGLPIGSSKGEFSLEQVKNLVRLNMDLLNDPEINNLIKSQIRKQLEKMLDL